MKNNYKDRNLAFPLQARDSASRIRTGWQAPSWLESALSPLWQLTICVLLLMSAYPVMAQQNVSGTVTDANGEGVPGVSVYEKGTTNGTITDFNGNYALKVKQGSTIVFQSMGYATQEILVGAQTRLDIIIKDDTETLDEVIVVGYGVQQKREITGSIAKVEGAKLLQTQTPSFEAALQGQAAGVQVIQGSGLAGSGSVIRIRGTNSISSGGDPLYVVDGIPITADQFLAENNFTNGAFNNNPLASINPNDIESVEILKDAAATGIYGSRGANGVILITTKRGSSRNQRPQFNFTVNVGTSDPVNDPNLLSGPEWLAVRQEAWELDGNTGAVWIPGYSNANDPADVRRAAFDKASQVDTDWWDLMTQTGVRQQYDFSVNYGRKKFKTYLGFSYADNETFLVGNAFRRLSLRGNFDWSITPKLDLQVSASYSRSVNERVRVSYTGGLGDAMSTALPVFPVFNPDGTFFEGDPERLANNEITNVRGDNPVFEAANFQGFTVDKRTITTARLNYRPLKGLTISAFGGIDYLDQITDQFESGLFLNRTDPNNGRSERDQIWVTNFNLGATAEYQIPLNKNHDFKVLVGTEFQQSARTGNYNLVYQQAQSTIFSDEGEFSEENLDLGGFNDFDDPKDLFLSYFTRFNYTLKDRYIAQFSIRADGSSRFGGNNRFGYFPVAALGWIASEEGFLKDNKIISFLKLKTSLGLVGNAQIPDNRFVTRYFREDNPGYNGQPIRFPGGQPGNPNLQWESTLSFDAGFEIGFFDDRVLVEAAYFNRQTQDAFIFVTLPGYTGFADFLDNVAEIKNEGFDLDIKTRNIVTDNFTWSTSLNLSYIYNEVTSIGDYTEDAVSGGTNDTRVVEGSPVGTNFLIRYAGVDPATGRPIYLDANGFETFEYNEARDRVPVGDVLPDVTGGLNNTFSYKGFDFSFLFVFVFGGNIYDSSSKRQLVFLSNWVTREDVGDRWRQPGDQALYPRVTLDPAQHGNDKEWFNTDLFLKDATYVRLRNVSLSYNFPSKWVNKLGLSNIRLGVSATNLLTFTRFPGLDPEIVRDFDNVTDRNLSPNITFLTPPQERSFNFNLNVSF